MNGILWIAVLLGFTLTFPISAWAGWVAEWHNVPVTRSGERRSAEPSTMYVAKGKVRIVQPRAISLLDYDTGRYALLNPASQFFWSGNVDEYVAEMTKTRGEALRQRMGAGRVSDLTKLKIDPDSLPEITIKKTNLTEAIAGHRSTKYEIRVNDELFQEIWIAEDLDLSADLDPGKFLTYQRKMSAMMLGQSASKFNALYRSEQYRKLIEKGFAVKIITRHIAGRFERTARTIRESPVSASYFQVPDTYRRVRLRDMFPAEQDS